MMGDGWMMSEVGRLFGRSSKGVRANGGSAVLHTEHGVRDHAGTQLLCKLLATSLQLRRSSLAIA